MKSTLQPEVKIDNQKCVVCGKNIMMVGLEHDPNDDSKSKNILDNSQDCEDKKNDECVEKPMGDLNNEIVDFEKVTSKKEYLDKKANYFAENEKNQEESEDDAEEYDVNQEAELSERVEED